VNFNPTQGKVPSLFHQMKVGSSAPSDPSSGSSSSSSSSKKSSNSSRSSRSSGSSKHSTASKVHAKIPKTARKGENKFQGLTSIAESDPEEYIHPNYWKNINTIQRIARAEQPVKRQALSNKVVWQDDLSKFKNYKKIVMGHFRQVGMGYIFNSRFQELYLEHGLNVVDYWDETPITRAQLRCDLESLYGAMETSLRGNMGQKQLMQYEDEQDGIRVWRDVLDICDKGGSREIRIQALEADISVPFHKNYKGGLNAFITDYETAFMELTSILKVKAWEDEDTQKRRLLQNLEPLGMSWLDNAAKTMPLSEIYHTLRQIALKKEKRYLERSKAKANEVTAQLSHIEPDIWGKLPRDLRDLIIKWRKAEREEKDKKQAVEASANNMSIQEIEEAIQTALPEYTDAELATIDEFLKDQEEDEDEDEVNIFMASVVSCDEVSFSDIEEDEVTYGVPPLATLTQDSAETTSSDDFIKELDFFWRSNGIYLTTDEADSSRPDAIRLAMLKKKFGIDVEPINLSHPKKVQKPKKKPPMKFIIPRPTNIKTNNEDTFQDIIEDQELQEVIEDLASMDTEDNSDVTSSSHSINNVSIKMCGVNIGDTNTRCIFDSGADTSVIGKGWKVINFTSKRAYVIGFQGKLQEKHKFPMVSAITAVDLEDKTIIIRIHEAVMNDKANHSLLSEFQVRECVYNLNSVWKKHGGSQTLSIKEDIIIPLQLKNCMMIFHHREPTEKEIKNLPIYDVTRARAWNPKSYNDECPRKVVDLVVTQDTFQENHNSNPKGATKHDDTGISEGNTPDETQISANLHDSGEV